MLSHVAKEMERIHISIPIEIVPHLHRCHSEMNHAEADATIHLSIREVET